MHTRTCTHAYTCTHTYTCTDTHTVNFAYNDTRRGIRKVSLFAKCRYTRSPIIIMYYSGMGLCSGHGNSVAIRELSLYPQSLLGKLTVHTHTHIHICTDIHIGMENVHAHTQIHVRMKIRMYSYSYSYSCPLLK